MASKIKTSSTGGINEKSLFQVTTFRQFASERAVAPPGRFRYLFQKPNEAIAAEV
jgi:hypothetical protein